MLSQLEGGEEQWVPDPQDLEGRDILKVTYTGEDLDVLSCPVIFTVSLNKKSRALFFFPKSKAGVQKVWKADSEVRLCGLES